jgi:hypothetical protein
VFDNASWSTTKPYICGTCPNRNISKALITYRMALKSAALCPGIWRKCNISVFTNLYMYETTGVYNTIIYLCFPLWFAAFISVIRDLRPYFRKFPDSVAWSIMVALGKIVKEINNNKIKMGISRLITLTEVLTIHIFALHVWIVTVTKH